MAGDQSLEKKKRLEVVVVDNTSDETCQTFVMHEEDHTLGNALRYMVMKNPETEFCGYSVPHPSENKINFRIQTKGLPAADHLKKGLEDVNKVCQHVLSTFEKSIEKYKKTQSTEEPMDT